MHTLQIEIRERDGYDRRSFPRSHTQRFEPGQVPADARPLLHDDDGKELPAQFDVLSTHPDGTVLDGEITFAPHVAANAVRVYRLDLGDVRPEAAVRNPVTIESTIGGAIVRQGVIEYTLVKSRYNFVDEAVFRDRAFLRSGSRGPVISHAGREDILPAGEARFEVTHSGPWMGGLRITGNYADGRTYSTEMRFVSTKSWFSARHVVEGIVEGDAVWLEANLLLGEKLDTAYGARRAASGLDTSWGVVTDGDFTVDTGAAVDPAAARDLRHEITGTGVYRMRLPTEHPPTIWFHYLHGPPDDVKNTPAAAMAAGL